VGEETARLREEIDRTREDLTRDVDLLADKTSPSRILERRVERTRTGLRRGMTGLREKVMGSSPTPGRYRSVPAYAEGAYGGYGSTGYVTAMPDEPGEGEGGVGERLRSARESASDVVSRGADTARESVSHAREQVVHAGERTQQAAHEAVTGVREQTEGNPLAAGLVAFGVGWLVSSLMPASEAEQEAARRAAEVARERGGPVLEQAKQAATDVGETLQSEAQEAAQHIKERAQEAAGTVKETAMEEAKSSPTSTSTGPQ
jgi:hypothetical protein